MKSNLAKQSLTQPYISREITYKNSEIFLVFVLINIPINYYLFALYYLLKTTLKKESEYFLDKEYNAIIYGRDEVNFKDFECCIFNNCNFSACTFLAVTFIDCVFNDCIFSEAKINYVAFRTATFNRCEIKEVNFAMCDKLIFEIHFYDCILDFSKFYTLKIKGTTFTNCSLIAVDFMATDLTSVVFDNCDLYRSEFDKAIANKADFKTSYNYTIDPSKTKLKKAVFALKEVKGLLFKHDIIVS